MKEFDLHKAKMGAEVCTREGGYAKITTFDSGSEIFPITAIFQQYGYEVKDGFTNKGTYWSDGEECVYDLMLK